MIKEKLTQYFTVWWIPLCFYMIPLLIVIFTPHIKKDWIIDLSLSLFFINFLGTILSSLVHLVTKKWIPAVFQIIVSFCLLFFISILFILSPPDNYGVDKEIPKGIEIYEPITEKLVEEDLIKNNLIIGSYFQPGIYTYYTDFKPKELGYFYIKAFEITSNDRLSEERITRSSKISVEDFTNQIYTGEFTIYEGSFGDKYAGRIELWFSPKNGKEYKITERNYIVEGWMR
ncbi:hypothetical protein WAF17_09605 [Bernardetia sp. ABR2-2B]|uniref:hypothetical protein n=1 Tax=Bernardetia sp. ABR2-2B TaxID=3127472 RepID=UPI0030CF9BA0